MPMPVNFSPALPPALPGESSTAPAQAGLPGGISFQDLLQQSIEQVNGFDRQAQSAVAAALTGDDLTQAEVFTAMKKADLALRTMLQIRNKLVEAYNEIKNMRM
jgi:flagellar hook-basal body complex protein FliE